MTADVAAAWESMRRGERERIAATYPDHEPAQVQRLADVILRVEINWNREGSGPGSRFEGQRREVAQAVGALNEIFGNGAS
jgi:hypothetical protein